MGAITKGMMSSSRGDWETPKKLFDAVNEIWHFDLDAASSEENALCDAHFTPQTDGLKQSWGGVPGMGQPSLWKGDRGVGGEGGPRISEAKHHRRHAATGEDGHQMVARPRYTPCNRSGLHPRKAQVHPIRPPAGHGSVSERSGALRRGTSHESEVIDQ